MDIRFMLMSIRLFIFLFIMTKAKFILFSLVFTFVAALAGAANVEVRYGYALEKPESAYGSYTSAKGAIYIPAEVAQLYKGTKVTGVQVGLLAEASSVNVFVTKNLNGTSLATGSAQNVASGATVINTTSEYVIDGEGFYVGYSYSGSSASLGCCDFKNENGCWVNTGSGWLNASSEGKTLSIRAVISGDASELPNDFAILNVQGQTVECNQASTVTLNLVSFSPTLVRKCELAYSVDGGAEKTLTPKGFVMSTNTEKQISFTIDPFEEVGTHTVKVRIKSIAGSDTDAYSANNSAEGTVEVKRLIPKKRFFMETSTSLDCGWCPRAKVAMENFYESLPDNFVGVEVFGMESGDMYTSSYNDFVLDYTPTCEIDRDAASMCYGDAGTLAAYMNAMGYTSDVQVDVEGAFVDNSTTQINAKATATFVNAKSNLSYRWSFIVTEDGVPGTQKNYYANNANGKMGGWESRDAMAKYNHDHVARYNYGFSGFLGSVPTAVTAFEPVEYTKVLDLPGTVIDNSKLRLIAILIDNNSGKIVNAAETKLTGAATSIADLQSASQPNFRIEGHSVLSSGNAKSIEVYSMSGARCSSANLPSGAYIVKIANGNGVETHKIFIGK